MANIIAKCPQCNKTAKVKNEFTIDAIKTRYTVYECGHTIKVKLSTSETADIDAITARNGHKPFPFQSKTVQFLEKANLSGIVNHEMGLGKTIIECLLLRRHLNELTPALIVTKAGLLHQWFGETFNWTGQIPQILTAQKPNPVFDFHNIFIVSQDSLYRLPWMQTSYWDRKLKVMVDIDTPEKKAIRDRFKHVCVDEVQGIKNKDAKRTRAVKELGAGKSVVTLSGTPIKNNVEEYFSCLNLVRPDKFPSEMGFLQRFVKINRLTGKTQGLLNPEKFQDYTKDFIIRFERETVLPDLPKIFRQFHSADMTEQSDKDAYEGQLDEFLEYMNKLESEPTSGDITHILAYFNKMRHSTGLAKIKPTVEYVENFLLSTNRKITIFCHHKDVLEYTRNHINGILKAGGYAPCLSIVSEMNSSQRTDTVEAFKKPENRVLIASTLAAGEGLNLQVCSDCIIMERQWNPANEEQAEARFPRPGSTASQVNAAYMIAAGTIDEMFTEIVERKRAMMKQVLNGTESKWDDASLMKELTTLLVAKGKSKWRATI